MLELTDRKLGNAEVIAAKGGLDGILATAISGINAMPPKGTCGDCSDDELLGAIKQMSGL